MAEKRVLPPLTALRAFETAARHMSFKLAAHEMHVTASAVSHAVATLESFLGIKLFHRRTRKLLLTDAGSAYLSPVSRAFDAIGVATREVSARSHADILTVVCSPTFSRSWLIPRLGEFLDLYPDIDLRLLATIEAVLPPQSSTTGGHRELGQLLHSEVDAAIVYGQGGWHGFLVDQLVDEVMVPLCTPALRDGPRTSARTGRPDRARAHLYRDEVRELGHVARSGRRAGCQAEAGRPLQSGRHGHSRGPVRAWRCS